MTTPKPDINPGPTAYSVIHRLQFEKTCNTNSFTFKDHKIMEFLSIQMQNDTPTLWYECDPSTDKIEYQVAIVGTGQPMTEKFSDECSYVGTFQQDVYVWHVYIKVS